MQQTPHRCIAVHDLSGVGRCSLSVIIPVMSVMGIQVCALPTAVLSTHTGGFGEVARCDLTDYIPQALSRYEELGMHFSCVYTGYLGSVQQVDDCRRLLAANPQTLAVVDPVMGDHGKVYRSFTPELVEGIGRLVAHADVITPNLTEAHILLGEKQDDYPLTASAARSLLARLSALGPKLVVVTGVALATGEYGNICMDAAGGAYWKSTTEYLPVQYPGTGDIFAAVLTASLLSGDSPSMAMDRATRYVELTIKTTYGYNAPSREGVLLELTLPWLTRRDIPQQYEPL